MTVVEHRLTPGDDEYRLLVENLVRADAVSSVCEIGGGSSPMLTPEFVASTGIRYLVIDVSAHELSRAPDGVETLVADVSNPEFVPPAEFDLVVTRWVLEHVRDPAGFHRGVAVLLRRGGRAVHLFSTLYALPFTVNLVLPERLGRRLLRRLGRDRSEQGKFPAHYRWCRGPTRRQIRRFEEVGFEIEGYTGLYGNRYYQRLPALQALEDRLAAVLARRRMSALTSYAWVVMRRP